MFALDRPEWGAAGQKGMSFLSRALERDIDRLVQESPIPQSVLQDDHEFSNLLHTSYILHSRPQGSVSSSATAKLKFPSNPTPQTRFNPFHSAQVLPRASSTLNESTQSVAELFNSLKKDVSASTSNNTTNTSYFGPRNVSFRGRGIRDYQETFEDCFEQGGDRNHGNDSSNEDVDDSVEGVELEACSLYMWIIKPAPGLAAVRIEGKKSLTDNEFWQSGIVTERLHEKLVKTQSGSVYRLEGNMALMDALAAGFSKPMVEAFWLGFPEDWEQLIQDHFNKYQYSREPLDTVPETTPAEIEEEICMIEAADESDIGEDCQDNNMDVSDVGLSEGTVEGIINTLDRDINDTESAIATDNDEDGKEPQKEISQSSTGDRPKKTRQTKSRTTSKPQEKRPRASRKSGMKEYVLTNWIIKPLPTGLGIHLSGLNQEGVVWNSSAIERRLDKKKLLTSGGSIYRLKGNIDTLMAVDKGIPDKLIEKFKTGFPKEWLELIQEHLSGKPKQKQRIKSETRTKSSKLNSYKGTKIMTPKNVQKPSKKSSMSEKIVRNVKSTSVSSKQNVTIGGISSKGSSVKKKTLKSAEKMIERPANVVLTPNGALVDLDKLPSSRSGRLIKPPLCEWAGQQLCRGENGYYVTARTECAKQYCDEIENTIWNSATRMRNQYLKQKNKESDTSDNASSCSKNSPIVRRPARKTAPASMSKTNRKSGSRTFNKKRIETVTKLSEGKRQSLSSKEPHCSRLDESTESANSEGQGDLAKQIKVVLERHKLPSTRKKVRLSSPCYQNNRETTTTQKCDDDYCLDVSVESADTDKSNKQVKKSHKTSDNGANQVSIVSSTTSDVKPSPLKTRSRTKSSGNSTRRSVTVEKLDSDPLEGKSRRSIRVSKRLSNITEHESSSECHDTSLDVVDKTVNESQKKQKSRQRTKQRGKTKSGTMDISIDKTGQEVNESQSELNETVVDDSCWTAADLDRLNEAYRELDVEDRNFWQKVAERVKTKTAEACQEQFYSTKKPESTKKGRKSKESDRQKATALTANRGTLKRKQQLTDILHQLNDNHTDKLFDSTPFRKSRKRKINRLEDMDGDKFYEETLKRQGKTCFETPKAEDVDPGRRRFLRQVSAKKTPMSMVTIDESVEIGKKDAYVHNLVKRGVHKKVNRKCLSTPKSTKTVTDVNSPQQRLFINELLANQSDQENHADSEGEDYYWDQDLAN